MMGIPSRTGNASLSALRNLQEKLKVDGKLSPWLEKHGLQDLSPLWNLLQIEAGWENALANGTVDHLPLTRTMMLSRAYAAAKRLSENQREEEKAAA